MATTLALRAQQARHTYDRSQKTNRDLAKYFGACATLAFEAWVENHNIGKAPAARLSILPGTLQAVRLMGEAMTSYLTCPVDNDHHHETFAGYVWGAAVQTKNEYVATVRNLATHLGLVKKDRG